mmetsp:Transcript_41033/g.123877  ORF Transcript_41033/g.123877 Transcript_41033/m.123877 type:complete len:94 (-) Transcript_41033:17-298(-)
MSLISITSKRATAAASSSATSCALQDARCIVLCHVSYLERDKLLLEHVGERLSVKPFGLLLHRDIRQEYPQGILERCQRLVQEYQKGARLKTI